MASQYDVAVIGGGAGGLVAAITLARRGRRVIILEKGTAIGKKILISGNGRCNLSNDRLGEDFFNQAARPLVKSVFSRSGKEAIDAFFHRLGLATYSDDGRIFPVTNQASSVLRLLRIELGRLGIPIELGFGVNRITNKDGLYSVWSGTGKTVLAEHLIAACGGKSYPATGCDGSLYPVLSRLGHSIVEPVPAAVPLVVKDRLCHRLQGQKIRAAVTAMIGDDIGESAEGDLLFTQYGLSGTAVIDISDGISCAINRGGKKDVSIIADLAPSLSAGELKKIIADRLAARYEAKDLLVGIVSNKCAEALVEGSPASADAGKIVSDIKARRFVVHGTRGWNEAEFTSGGVIVDDVHHSTLESKICPGLYFTGEVLDVNGRRGGYNLAWAWASGLLAGAVA